MSDPHLFAEQAARPRFFVPRMALIFATLCIPVGIHMPYFPLWLEGLGFGPAHIAVILSAPMFLRVVTTPCITALADRASDRAPVYVAMVGGSLVASLGFFLPPSYAVILAISLLYAVFVTPQPLIADSLALSGVRRFGANYANMRIWGSIAYLSANLCGGWILAWTGPEAVPFIISLTYLVALGAALLAPRLGVRRKASALSPENIRQSPKLVFNRRFLLFASGGGLFMASHGFLFGFGSIYWKSIGISDSAIGLLWCWAVLAETGTFLVFKRLFAGRSLVTLLVIAGVGCAVRWAIMPHIAPLGLGLPGFIVAQSLHSLSVGLVIIGLPKLIAELVPEELTGSAQGIVYFANGIFTALVTLASGPLYDRFGALGFNAMVPVSLLGIGCVLLAARARPA